MPWSARFDAPIILADGRKLATLRDAIKHLGEMVPKRELNHPRVMIAATVLTDAAEGRDSADRGAAGSEPARHQGRTGAAAEKRQGLSGHSVIKRRSLDPVFGIHR